jgi:AraC-like DNA-binding protein
MNRHSFFEVAYACSGTLELQVQDNLFQVGPGELMVVGGSLYHRMTNPPHAHARIAALYFEPELIRRSSENGEGNEYLAPFLLQNAEFPHVVSASTGIPAEVFKLMQRVHGEIPANSARARLAVQTYLKMILMLLVNHYAGITGTQEVFVRRQLDIERLRPIFEYLETHYSQTIRVRDAARIAAMSDSHLMWFFKRVTGQSFLSYVNHFRVAKAQLLLATTNKSICEVSQDVGFCDQSHFGVVFREMVGMTPLAYRRHADEAPRCQPAAFTEPPDRAYRKAHPIRSEALDPCAQRTSGTRPALVS